MALDINVLADKLKRYRSQFDLSHEDMSKATGIPTSIIIEYEKGLKVPSGDEILIIADFFKCDYRFFISNEKLAPFEQTETLFRRYSKDFSPSDRWAVQEILFLSDCESYLDSKLNTGKSIDFVFEKKGNYFKQHGIDAADQLRINLGYKNHEVSLDIFLDFRKIGIRVYRRELENRNISGLFILHPKTGKCIVINYSDDIYRQRFTAAHEAAHAIFDSESDVIV